VRSIKHHLAFLPPSPFPLKHNYSLSLFSGIIFAQLSNPTTVPHNLGFFLFFVEAKRTPPQLQQHTMRRPNAGRHMHHGDRLAQLSSLLRSSSFAVYKKRGYSSILVLTGTFLVCFFLFNGFLAYHASPRHHSGPAPEILPQEVNHSHLPPRTRTSKDPSSQRLAAVAEIPQPLEETEQLQPRSARKTKTKQIKTREEDSTDNTAEQVLQPRSSVFWPPPSWAWPLDKGHLAEGAEKFGIHRRRPSWASSPTETPEKEQADEIQEGTCIQSGESKENLDFTLVSQASAERLWMLPYICQRWQGPIVLAIDMVGFTSEDEDLLSSSRLQHCLQLHVVRFPPTSTKKEGEKTDRPPYPINTLRNLAVAEVQTSHYLLTDVDFWPSEGLYPLLRRLSASLGQKEEDMNEKEHEDNMTAVANTQDVFLDPLHALVVPAFRYLGARDVALSEEDTQKKAKRDEKTTLATLAARARNETSLIPFETDSLMSCLDRRDCIVFDQYKNPGGHGTTNSSYWAHAQGRAEIRPIPCLRSRMYEPYVVLRRCPTTPPFAEAFTGYGWNKIQHIHHLRARGFKFSVLPPPAFLVHFPHEASESRKAWVGLGTPQQKQLERGKDKLMSQFSNWLRREKATIEGRTIPKCS
jgi:hypothetical protein